MKDKDKNDNVYTIKYVGGNFNNWHIYINDILYGFGFKTEFDAMKALNKCIRDDKNNVTNLDPIIEEINAKTDNEFIKIVENKLISLSLGSRKKKLSTIQPKIVKVYRYDDAEYIAEIRISGDDKDIWYVIHISNRESYALKYSCIKPIANKDI